MTPLPAFGFHHVAISVPDIAAATAWYREMLGFEADYGFDLPGGRAQFLTLGDLKVELFEMAGAAPLPDDRRDVRADLQTHGTKHVAFSVADYDGILAGLAARDVPIALRVGGNGGRRACFIHDNSGNLLEFVET